MKKQTSILWALGVGLALASAAAEEGPFPPDAWPPTIDPNAIVHYVDVEGALIPPSGNWDNNLQILSGGDQATEDITIGGYKAKKVTGAYLNVADSYYTDWAAVDTIDILVLVYGNEALLGPDGQARDYRFLTGALPETNSPVGGQIPPEAKNGKWNWVLFRIPNELRPSDGLPYVGTLPLDPQGNYSNGGVNGGTIRFQQVPGWIVRVIAFGEPGAFGEPEQINHFFPPESCDPEPPTNLVGIDLNAQTTNHVVVMDDKDQTVFYADDVGPEGDKRRAVAPVESYLNFGITDNYLGKPCNDPRSVKVCVEFYDDPAFAGMNVRFGPEAYATDAQGGVAIYPEEKRHLLEGTGQWIRRSWTIPAVNLYGVNTAPYTGGPRFISENAPVFVSKFEMAVLRVGDHPLAGQDPLADCFEDPNICTDAYGNFVELDLDAGVVNGLDVGTSSGDQEMIVEEAGPPGDRRMAVRPAFDDGTPGFTHQYLNFAILDEALGPSSQPPAHLAICVTYYDDPALIGARFKPEVYKTEVDGVETFAFTPDDFFVTIEGTDEWRTAYWEIPDVKFTGVNQGPQAAARFVATDKVYFTAVKYAVIRPCGPMAGVNLLEDCKPTPVALAAALVEGKVQISWPADAAGFTLQQATSLVNSEWAPVAEEPELQGDSYLVTLPLEGRERYFRLIK